MNYFVSTNCLADADDLLVTLKTYAQSGLLNVELGACKKYVKNASQGIFRLKEEYNLNLIAHHYFMPIKDTFIVNLASPDKTILRKSIEYIKGAIQFCHILGIRMYSVHAGFSVDPDFNFNFSYKKENIYRERAFEIFIETIRQLNTYAQERKVRLAIENNVLTNYNLVEGENRLLLLCELEEYEKLFELIPSDNLGVNLDFGHLKVTAKTLKYNCFEMIEKLTNKIFLFHAHDNDGDNDQHRTFDSDSWFLPQLNNSKLENVPLVIEGSNLTIDGIKKQLEYLLLNRRIK